MAGLYGFGGGANNYRYANGFGKGVPDNWAGHDTIPDFLRQDMNELGNIDERPSHMRSGFYPSFLAMDNALGGAVEPQKPPRLVVLEKGLGEAVFEKLKNPLVIGAGILAGILLISHFTKG